MQIPTDYGKIILLCIQLVWRLPGFAFCAFTSVGVHRPLRNVCDYLAREKIIFAKRMKNC